MPTGAFLSQMLSRIGPLVSHAILQFLGVTFIGFICGCQVGWELFGGSFWPFPGKISPGNIDRKIDFDFINLIIFFD
jgi:hypothetical protein